MSYLLDELDGKIETAQSSLSSTRRKINDAQSEIQEAMNGRNAAVIQLAQIYLPDLKAETVKGTIDELDDEAKVAYDAHKKRSATIDATIAKLDTQRITLQKAYAAAASKFKEADEFEDGVRAELEKKLGTDTVYVQRKADADKKEEVLNRHVARAKDAVRERDTKLPSYEQNPIFRYLLRVGYDTKDTENSRYRPATSIIQRLDRMVAELIRFSEQSQTYTKLKQLPELIQEIVDTEEGEVEKLQKNADARKEELAQELGLPKALQTEKTLRDALAAAKLELTTLESTYSQLTEERSALQTENNRFYQELVSKAQRILGSSDIQELRDIARRTPDARDDKLVEKMSEYESIMSQQRSIIGTLQSHERSISSTLSSLQVDRDAEHRRIEAERRRREEERRAQERAEEARRAAERARRAAQSSSYSTGRSSFGGGFSTGRSSFGGGGFRTGRSC